MFAKLAIPAFAALALSAGLGATPAAAAPHGHPGPHHHFSAPHRVCTPILKWVRVPNRHGHGWHWAQVRIGQTCHWVYRR